MKKALSLYELNSIVRETIEEITPDEYWVEAELSEVHEIRGHCFLELIQKDEKSNTPIAKASAKIWVSRWMLIRPHFERVTGQHLRTGMKVLLCVSPNFHEAYGFSWIVNDIDATYTVGDTARRRQEIIDKLKKAGIFTLNKELDIPMFAQNIAVISSETAAGYGDFCNQLKNNRYGFNFNIQLFSAIMQGELVEKSIIAALNTIYENADNFDVVVIIRGGGATSDLSGFDTIDLAENVAQFPLPVITGIGHERDDTILDLISNTRVKTPTAAAEFLIDRLVRVDKYIDDIQARMVNTITQHIKLEKLHVDNISSRIPTLFSLVRTKQEARLDGIFQNIVNSLLIRIERTRNHINILNNNIQLISERTVTLERHRVEIIEQRIDAANPERLLRRGYSITLYQGKSVHDPNVLKHGDEIVTKLEKGTITSIIK
jgi:exodeoxyribonuclease VII large subunit